MNAYFSQSFSEGEYPTEAGMILALGDTVEEYSKKLSDKDYGPVLERAKLRRKAWLENRMVMEPKCATGCMNALLQEENGGYKAKNSADTKERKLTIRLDGVGKDAAK